MLLAGLIAQAACGGPDCKLDDEVAERAAPDGIDCGSTSAGAQDPTFEVVQQCVHDAVANGQSFRAELRDANAADFYYVFIGNDGRYFQIDYLEDNAANGDWVRRWEERECSQVDENTVSCNPASPEYLHFCFFCSVEPSQPTTCASDS